MNRYPLSELSKLLHSSPPVILHLQKSIDLPIPPKAQGYSRHHLNFLKKVLSLRAFCVPFSDIKELFETEQKILLLLHVDSLSHSSFWYLDYCITPEAEPNRLLLTGYKPDFSLDSREVQHTLDFSQKSKELFNGNEMGEDLRRVLGKYRDLAREIREKVAKEKALVEEALDWSDGLLKKGL
jgi:hypothetical protein